MDVTSIYYRLRNLNKNITIAFILFNLNENITIAF